MLEELFIQGGAEPTDTFQMVIDNIWKQGKISEPVYKYVQVCYLLATYCTLKGVIRRHFGKQMNKETTLRIHNITAKAALKFGSEAWVLKKREEQRLEAAQIKFLRHLLGITKLDKENNVLDKTREHRT